MSPLPKLTYVPVQGNKDQWRVFTGHGTQWETFRGFVYRRTENHFTNSESSAVFRRKKHAGQDLLRSPHTR